MEIDDGEGGGKQFGWGEMVGVVMSGKMVGW